MTTPTTEHTTPVGDLTGGRRRATLVASLAVSQTIVYGTLYYAFADRWPRGRGERISYVGLGFDQLAVTTLA